MPDTSRALRSPGFPLALALAALAGWVDATAFVRLARTYVSFMSGNSTKLAAALSAAHPGKLLLLVCVLAGFVAGVVAGETLAAAAGRRGHAAVLLAESFFLFAAMAAAFPGGNLVAPALLLAFALGIQNASVHEVGGVSVAITYMTGTLVHIGRQIAAALAGRDLWAAPLPYLLLWLALMAGAAGGAAFARVNATFAIGTAAVAALGLAGLVLVAREPQARV
ncbi:MAG TPA: DUF1275 family protein [Rhizomicrobium sp.]|jgi:uncharacterized membrane protein YoaK (UPF0700 family)|nr:DUF1275 family protein [Rhizomicrobium sp.]